MIGSYSSDSLILLGLIKYIDHLFNGSDMERPLTSDEKQLIRWMLEHGNPGAQAFLSQLDKAKATPWGCPCGCASINVSIDGLPEPSGGLHILADFIFGTDADLSGVFVLKKSGVLAGLGVYGLAGPAPKTLPLPEDLRPFG
ncbi:MAG: hypothetical protein LAP40_24515 [Acidobacteriia bacterium]|nr:hypothetical protein [Terriglobia bacterium]